MIPVLFFFLVFLSDAKSAGEALRTVNSTFSRVSASFSFSPVAKYSRYFNRMLRTYSTSRPAGRIGSVVASPLVSSYLN